MTILGKFYKKWPFLFTISAYRGGDILPRTFFINFHKVVEDLLLVGLRRFLRCAKKIDEIS